MTTQRDKRGVRSLTRSLTCVSFEKREGYSSRDRIKTRASNSPIKIDVTTATTNENLAVFGWTAPSSFDTRTLQIIHYHNNLLFIYYAFIYNFLCDEVIIYIIYHIKLIDIFWIVVVRKQTLWPRSSRKTPWWSNPIYSCCQVN